MYSASIELSTTDLCFMLYQEIVADPTLKITPDVLLLSDGIPAQSTSVNPYNFTPFVRWYHNPY